MRRELILTSFLLVTGFMTHPIALIADSTLVNDLDALDMGSYSYEEVWSDDFNDGNYNDWGTKGINITGEGVVLSTPNLSVTDGVLWAGEGPHFNIANHSSTIVYGKWEFDIYVIVGPWHHSAVYLTKDGWELQEGPENGYAIAFAQQSWDVSQPGIHIAKSTDYHSTWHEYWLTPVNDTWFHVEVTHLENGTFNVYINGTHRIEWVDDSLPNSTHLELALEPGCRVDNIVVSELVEDTDITNTSDTTPPPGIPMEWLAMGIGAPLILVIVLIVWKIRK